MKCEYSVVIVVFFFLFIFFQAEDGIRDLVRSRGLGDVYKRQVQTRRNQYDIILQDQILKVLNPENGAQKVSIAVITLEQAVGLKDKDNHAANRTLMTLSLIHI